MSKIKVLWLSGTQINRRGTFFYETWLTSMAKILVDSNKVDLYNVTQSNNKDIVYIDDTDVVEWIVPVESSKQMMPPSASQIKYVNDIVKKVNPDIVHIWGLEKNWGLLTSMGILGDKVLLEIQGLKYTCSDVFYGGMGFKDIISTLRVQELLYPSRFIVSMKRQFKKWGEIERNMISSHRYIGTQSDWVRDHIKLHNNTAITYNSKIALREEFLESDIWSKKDNNKVVLLTSSSFATPYKGIHDLLYVLKLLKNKYPKIILKIAGDWPVNNPFYRQTGYLKWFLSKAKSLNVFNCIEFLGPLGSSDLIKQLNQSDVFIVPSYVESYSLALAEAMSVGVPCVASYVGGMAELGVDNDSVLFFNSGDYHALAGKIDKVISNSNVAKRLSINARKTAHDRNSPIDTVNRQLEIYSEIIKS